MSKKAARSRDKHTIKPKEKYRLKNWATYNKALKQRGSLEIWLEESSLRNWLYQGKKIQGGNMSYSNRAIKLCLSLRQLFSLPLRQTTGLVVSLFNLMQLKLRIPDYTTLSRRAGSLKIALPQLQAGQGATLVIDSTGLKVYAAGEWREKKWKTTRHTSWRKLHIVMGSADQVIYESSLTRNAIDDAHMVAPLLVSHSQGCTKLIADGAYDKNKVYKYLHTAKIGYVIPPRIDGVAHKKETTSHKERNAAIREIQGDVLKRKEWKKRIGYHKRSLIEVCMHRYKRVFGERLLFRNPANQETETRLNCELLNKMWSLGTPESYKVA